jgi:hypothetical protein
LPPAKAGGNSSRLFNVNVIAFKIMTEETRRRNREQQLKSIEKVIKSRPDLRIGEISSGLTERIKIAFSDVQYPKNEYISGSQEHNEVCWEHRECNDFFEGKRWEDCLEEDSYRTLCGGQAYFNPQAWHYYLPAYLIQCLIHNKFSAIALGGFLDGHYSAVSEWIDKRIELLTSAQCLLIVEYLELSLEFWKGVSEGYEDDLKPLNYWRENYQKALLKEQNLNK